MIFASFRLYATVGAAALVLGFAGWQWRGKVQAERQYTNLVAQIALEKAQDVELNRETERLLGTSRSKAADRLLAAQTAVAAAGSAADARLRALAAAWAASSARGPAGTTCWPDGAPIAAVIRDEDRRDLVQVGKDAESLAQRLGVCQQYLTEVKSILDARPGLSQ